jgi:Zn-dependent metalloprotease
MYFLKTLLAGAAIVCLAVPLQAYKPSDAPKSAGLQKSSAQKSADPFVRGLKNLRRLAIDDLFDSAQDLSARQITVKTPFDAGREVPERINKRLRSSHSSVRVTRIDRDKLGLLHVRLSQFHRGIPVIGSDMIVHIDKNNNVFAVSGTLAPLLDIDTAASVRLAPARLAAERSVKNGSRSPEDSSKLVVFDGRLAYEVLVGGNNGEPELYKCYVDAKSGEVLFKQSQIMPGAPSGSGAHELVSGTRLTGEGGNIVSMTGWHDAGGNYFFYNKDSVWGIYNLLSADWEQRATSSWGTSDPAAMSLGKNFSIIQNYTRGVLGIYSFNNAGAFARANVHEGTSYVNAFWDGSDFHFGDGNGTTANALTVLDVAAHEYGHAITQYSSNLVYSYESGALNESYSDIMGTLVEFWAQPDGRSSYPGKITGAADWLCGEDCWLSDVALRDLRNPQRYGNPSYYLGTYWYTGSGDNGGVHYNSGVQNFAFYLLSEGGTGSNDGHAYNITGIGVQHAGDIAMYANMHLLTSSSQYRDARDAWIMAASLYGYNATTVSDVWTACGVLPLVKHLSASPTSLAFGPVGAGSSDTLKLVLSNNGASSTIVSGLTFGDPWFTAATAVPFTVPGGGTFTLKVAFNPLSYASRTSTLTITSNADDYPSISIGLSGTGVAPAAMFLTPSSLHATLLAGDSMQQTVQCTNSGTAPLKIRITKTETDTPVAAWAGEQRWNYSRTPENGLTQTARPAPAGATESAVVTPPFFDGFEQGNFNNWTPGGGSYVRSVTNATAASGRYSFTQTGGASNHFDGVSASVTTPQQPDVVSFSVRAQSNNLDHGYFVLCGASSAQVIWFFMTSNGYFYANGNQTCPYAANTWYSIRFILHWAAGNFDYYVNNTLVASAIAFRTNTPVTTIYLYNFSNSQAWWDNINFGGVSDNTWLTCSFDTATILSGQSVPIPVRMNSAGLAGGNYAGALSIFHNAPATPSPAVVPCTLTVRGVRRLAVSPTVCSFGNVWAGAHGSTTITLRNPGTEATQVDSIVCSNPAFAGTATLPLIVRSNDSVRVTITFSPPVAGPYEGTVSIKSNAADNPILAVSVSGTGTSAPMAQLMPASLAFSLHYTDPPANQVSALSNIGGDLLVYSVTTAEMSRPPQGAPGLAWLSATPASGSLSPGTQQNLMISVNPAGCAAGRWVGRVAVASNDPVNPQVLVAVTADITACKKLSSDKNQLDFGTVWTGGNKQLTLTLANPGNDSVTVSALDFTSPLFSSSAGLPLKVPAFVSAVISVSFTPVDPGPCSGALTIRSNAEDNPSLDVALIARSMAPPAIAITPDRMVDRLNIGDTANRVLTIANAGGDRLDYRATVRYISSPAIVPDVLLPLRTGLTGPPGNKIAGSPENVATLSYGGQYLSFGISSYGEIMPFQYPVGTEHLQAGAYVSGYTVAYIAGGIDKVAYAAYDYRSGIVPVSYRDIVNDSVRSVVEVVTRTADTVLEICQQFTYGKRDRYIRVEANVKNISAAAVTNVVYKSCVDWDVDNGYSSDTFNYDAAHFMIYAKDRHFCTVAGATAPDYRDMDGWDDYNRRQTDGDYVNGPAVIDGLEILHYEIGALAPGASQTRVLAFCAADSLSQLQNTVSTALNESGWLQITSGSGSVAAGTSSDFGLRLNATGLLAGTYAAEIDFAHNAPGAPNPATVPCTLTINGTRHCIAAPPAFSFGGLWIGRETTTTITLSNNGNQPTLVTSITCNSPAFFSRATLPLTVPAYGSATFTATFAPVASGTVSGVMTVASNAMDNPELAVNFSGTGITPPHIAVAPSAISERAAAGSTASRVLTVYNTGGDILHFTSAAVDMTSGVNPAVAPLYGPEHFIPLAKGEPDNRVGYPVASMKGGPDSNGYRWVDSDESGGPVFSWTDIVTTGTWLSSISSCDDCYAMQNISFSFNFYGNTFTSIGISSNGIITLGYGTSSYSNTPLPSTSAPTNLIAGFWDDLSTSTSGDVYFKDYGDRAVVQWENVSLLGGGGALTFQIVLKNDGSICYYYKIASGTLTYATIGIQNQTATTGLTIAYNTTFVKSNLAVLITKRPQWLSIGTQSGTIASGGSAPIALTLNATELTQGTYAGIVRFTHDDPSTALPLDIPVTLLVSPTGALRCALMRLGPSMVASVQGTSYRMKTVLTGDVTAGVMRGSLYQLRIVP